MQYDIVVIGSGPGGYVCAIRCAQLGFKTAIIEKYSVLGGTCLNVGCIPSKALLDSSEHFYNAKTHFETHGIQVSGLKVNLEQMILRKTDVVDQNNKGVSFLMKKNKIDVLTGMGSFKSKNEISVTDDKGNTTVINTKYTVIATGSKPTVPPSMQVDKKRVITSTEALEIKKLPKTMTIIGGGVIGLELGSVYARLGVAVDVIEYADRIIPSMDKDCSKELLKILKKIGINFHLNHEVVEVKAGKTNAVTSFKAKGTDEIKTITSDYCLVSIGRKPYTEGLGLENVGVKTDDRGRIEVDNHLWTGVEGIYAIGDVIKGAMLAHKAEEEGVYVAESLAGQKPHINYNLVPSVVYTWPEVASVGQTEEQLTTAGIAYKVGKFPFKALGRSRASMDVDGFVKILASKETDEVLGVHIIGARAADLIAEAVTAMEFRASAEDIARICHAHPTYSEAMKEAALDATDKRSLHM